jgi:hypothetical protein
MSSPQTTTSSPAFRLAIACSSAISNPWSTTPDGPASRVASKIRGGPAGRGPGRFNVFFLAAMRCQFSRKSGCLTGLLTIDLELRLSPPRHG